MKIRSITDVITNSSTEVFIIKKDEIDPIDIKNFNTYTSKEEVYKIAENWNKGWENGEGKAIELIENIYRYIKYFNKDISEYDIMGLLTEYDVGPLANELGYDLVDVLKFLEPIWINGIEYGFLSWADDCGGEIPIKGNYEMIDRI